ncbi:hypothetical protein [Photobacterium sp. TY1-4]|uniref:hypothetical protein n=1 Tax=Photobacterium sp. TY1-4 TaxID=2899122 RepID=UPI0021BE7AE5|nr:hypothetical protein [Photobacterium sp. TY1-4]UXI01590.1 hypothetical protein NH461_01620 [Photobacterium sp. TY1-4]
MWRAGFNHRQQYRIHQFLWLSAGLVVVALLLLEGRRVYERAEQTRLDVLVQTLQSSASSLRQRWELDGRPARQQLDGIAYEFTRLGWPVVRRDGALDCEKIWILLSSRQQPVPYQGFIVQGDDNKRQNQTCFYEINDKKWVALFYESETIHINGFLTLGVNL